ncbi:MAG TPA: diacylglycerol kinase family protein [Capillimicrobium sp.]|nr:diacylglycerol kinase family protein [Capillimicrobium sp.]
MRLVLVANARSGSATDAGEIASRLRAHGADVTLLDIGEAERAADGRPDRIAVAGGDGSIGLVARTAARAELPLAVIPSGTANDFARALELPMELDAACALAADRAAHTTEIELAHAAERPFVNAASCGLSVIAARRAAPLKPRLGPLAYAIGALRAGASGRPIEARVTADGEPVHDGPAWQVVVGATGAFGGGSSLEAADPRDGLLDVAIMAAGSRAALVRHAWGMRFGRITEQSGVTHARAHRIEVHVPAGTRWNVDGEVCTLEPATFAAERGAVAVVVPR